MASERNKSLRVRSLVLNVFVVLSGLCFLCVRAETRTAVIDKETGQLSIREAFQEDFVAWANFTDDIKTSG